MMLKLFDTSRELSLLPLLPQSNLLEDEYMFIVFWAQLKIYSVLVSLYLFRGFFNEKRMLINKKLFDTIAQEKNKNKSIKNKSEREYLVSQN